MRHTTADDAVATATVNLRSWQAAYRGLVPDESLDQLDLDDWIARHRRQLATEPPPGVTRLVSEDAHGHVVAIANAGPAREPVGDATGELYLLYADPDVWGQGHGHALIEEVHSFLADQGHAAALLWVATGNDRTIAWYEAHGWALDGATDTMDMEGIEFRESRMVRDL